MHAACPLARPGFIQDLPAVVVLGVRLDHIRIHIPGLWASGLAVLVFPAVISCGLRNESRAAPYHAWHGVIGSTPRIPQAERAAGWRSATILPQASMGISSSGRRASGLALQVFPSVMRACLGHVSRATLGHAWHGIIKSIPLIPPIPHGKWAAGWGPAVTLTVVGTGVAGMAGLAEAHRGWPRLRRV